MKYVIYYRVSTFKQGLSGLGIEAQKAQVKTFLASRPNAQVICDFEEHESGRKANREKLAQAVAEVKKYKKGEATLLVAKLDRLARDTKFFLQLLDEIPLEFADLPHLQGGTSDTRFMLIQLSAFAELESSKISERTKQALQAKKARGFKLGKTGSANIKATNTQRHEQAHQFAQTIAPILAPLVGTMPYRQLAKHLNEHGIKSPTGGNWHLSTLQNVIKRIDNFV